MRYKIYTDGACSGNPGPGGWAAIILVDDKIRDEISGSEKNTTNNKMELLAPIRAIQKFKKKSLPNKAKIDNPIVSNAK